MARCRRGLPCFLTRVITKLLLNCSIQLLLPQALHIPLQVQRTCPTQARMSAQQVGQRQVLASRGPLPMVGREGRQRWGGDLQGQRSLTTATHSMLGPRAVRHAVRQRQLEEKGQGQGGQEVGWPGQRTCPCWQVQQPCGGPQLNQRQHPQALPLQPCQLQCMVGYCWLCICCGAYACCPHASRPGCWCAAAGPWWAGRTASHRRQQAVGQYMWAGRLGCPRLC